MSGRRTVYCSDFRDAFPDAPGCCASCHEEQALGYGMGFEWDDDLFVSVCCAERNDPRFDAWVEGKRAAPGAGEGGE